MIYCTLHISFVFGAIALRFLPRIFLSGKFYKTNILSIAGVHLSTFESDMYCICVWHKLTILYVGFLSLGVFLSGGWRGSIWTIIVISRKNCAPMLLGMQILLPEFFTHLLLFTYLLPAYPFSLGGSIHYQI